MFVRNLLLALGALCLAGGLFLSVLWYNQIASRSARAPEQQRPAVLVAARDVPAGTLLRPADMIYAEVPTSEIRPGALVRGRIAAAASFHGGNLASDAPDSPANGATSIKAKVYVGCAGVDNSFPPEQSARLAGALRSAEVDHILENYVGMRHGWCVPDHGVYDETGAERHWKRLTGFFSETLG